MQKTSFIFALAILFLSLSPCTDAWGDDDCQEHTHIAQDTDEQAPEGDTCTPFCSCACCRISVQQNDLTAPPEELTPTNFRPTGISGRIINPPFKIWQPPRA